VGQLVNPASTPVSTGAGVAGLVVGTGRGGGEGGTSGGCVMGSGGGRVVATGVPIPRRRSVRARELSASYGTVPTDGWDLLPPLALAGPLDGGQAGGWRADKLPGPPNRVSHSP